MQGKEAIIEKIIADAKAKEAAVLSDANSKASSIKSQASEYCLEYVANAKVDCDRASADVLSRSKTVAELDARKMLFDAKNKVVDSTFSIAIDKVKNLPKEKYSKLIFAMLNCAEDGDIVTISKREKDIITESSLKDFASKKKIKLALNKEFGNFDGGIILSGNGIDKNLTFDTEFQLLRDEIEETVAKKLFAED